MALKKEMKASNSKNCNHKGLGLYYLCSALLFGVSGTLCSMILRIELYSSGNRIIPPENQNFYNLSFTLHGLFMIFFLVMPGLYGGFIDVAGRKERSGSDTAAFNSHRES